jgi:hypothetical protein
MLVGQILGGLFVRRVLMKPQSKLLPTLFLFWALSLVTILITPTVVSFASSDTGSGMAIGIPGATRSTDATGISEVAELPGIADGTEAVEATPAPGITGRATIAADSLFTIIFPLLCTLAIIVLSLFIVLLAAPVGHYKRGSKHRLWLALKWLAQKRLAGMRHTNWHIGI